MKVTVAICTHNRAQDLGEAIQSGLDQPFGDGELEVIVIDNKSTDNTAQLVSAMQKTAGARLRYIMEPKLGLSVARNRAIKEARGEYILFLDDDAVASPQWARQIADIFESDPLIGCVGGKIDPIWQGEEPQWIPEEHRGVYTILDFSQHVTEMKPPNIPYGANVAFRKSVFKEMQPFREDLGRVGTNLLSSEESELIARLRQKYKVYYSPYASVQHKIAKERATKKWFLRRIFWQGVGDAVRAQDRSVLKIAKHSIRLLQALVTALLSIYNLRKLTRQLVNISYRNGSIVGILRYTNRG
ncbi:glycosyltransferase [Paenibacillus beijingensis]|uniref:Glycosyl transferase family 2 n=1 Tax=Paenibacillus beijingensis TaxID=1126833 RepID=A0A0D5NK44_9BACL|nr:glycosyltransferase [Paenibacillus beijingensis]AJY75714.1 glycosyl transferase family 2 [Paenibacillus beijingensis]